MFTNSLLSHTPAIAGLDRSIMVAPARLHLTLGVMHLVDKPHRSQPPTQAQSNGGMANERIFTTQEAIALLHSLREPLRLLLKAQGGDGTLRVPLNYAGVLQVERWQKGSSNVFWVGPSPDLVKLPGTLEHTLQEVGNLVNTEFKNAGFITEMRPLKLHCTLINTRYRKPRPKDGYPFNHEELFSSSAFMSHIPRRTSQPGIPRFADAPSTSTTTHQRNLTRTPTVTQTEATGSAKIVGRGGWDDEAETGVAGHPDFGTWTVQEIQLCQMIGKDPRTGAYISIGSIQLAD